MFDKKEALEFILKNIDRREMQDFADEQLRGFIAAAIDTEYGYIESLGDDEDYDDDDVYEMICDELIERYGVDRRDEIPIALLVDAYTDAMQDFLEKNGLISWQ